MRIVFLLGVHSDAHQRTRIDLLHSEGARPRLLVFEREYYPVRPHDYEIVQLGRLREGKYLARAWPIVRSIGKVRRQSSGSDALYVFGLDMVLLSWIALLGLRGRPPIVYELTDIRDALLRPGLSGLLLRGFERLLLRRIDLLLSTSSAYVHDYLSSVRGISIANHLVIENKVRNTAVRPTAQSLPLQQRQEIVIGYFGLLRCKRSLDVLLDAAEIADGGLKVVLRGIFIGLDGEEDSYRERATEARHLSYEGPYRNPDELAEIYGGVDLVWATYPHSDASIGNWKWARTNRFYESCFFNRPMIALQGTQDGRWVEEEKIGTCLSLADKNDAVQTILAIDRDEIIQWHRNVRGIPSIHCQYNGEHREVMKAIRKLTSTGRHQAMESESAP